ncbi:MAG: CHAT domain-containing protein [Spirochaetes bacterium]|nr:CHAT domain-containing protein [Spirochaetota bacterium]
MRIRIIDAALDNVDVIVDEVIPGTVENHKLIPKKLLLAFLDDWLDFVARVLAQKNSRPEDHVFDREVAERLRRYGNTLRTLLFQPSFDCADALQLVFSVDADWARLPFELLPMNRATENFAGLGIPILRQMRTVSARSETANTANRARNFLLLANPEGASDIAVLTNEEKKSLEHIGSGKVDMRVLGKLAATTQAVEELAHCEYLHYSGHVREQSLRFRDGALFPQDIAAMNLDNMKLAFINGCNSAGEYAQTGLAAAFLSAGVKNYIGYGYPVSDAAALFAAEAFWADFLRRENRSPILKLFYRDRKKSLSAIALSLRRAIFEKFGAAELAWLGIQFFAGAENRKRQKAGKFVIAAAAFFAIALSIVFFAGDRMSKPAEMSSKARLSQPENPSNRRRDKRTAKAAESRAPAARLPEKPIGVITSRHHEKTPTIQSPALASLVADFRTMPHPFYTKEDKERILSDVLTSDVPETSKIIRLKNELP